MRVYAIPLDPALVAGRLYISGHSRDTSYLVKRGLVETLELRRVINLWHDYDDDWSRIGPFYTYLPIPDGKQIPDDLFIVADGLWKELTMMPGGVLIQCHAGANRSALLAGMVMKCIGMRDVVGTIRAARGATALNNPTFAAYLGG